MTSIASESPFRNKIVMPILFDNVTKIPPAIKTDKDKIGHKVLEKRRLQLFNSVKNLFKKIDNSKQQSIAAPQRQGKSLSLSATKFRKSSVSTFASARRCANSHQQPTESKVYRTNIERLRLTNEIQSRLTGFSQVFVTKGQLPIRKSQNNCFELDFEDEIPKFGDLRWLIEAEQYNQDKLADIRKKIEMRDLKIRDLAQKQQQQRERQIRDYIEKIDVEGVDERDIIIQQQHLKKFEGIPSFLEELQKEQTSREERFKSPVKTTKLADSRLAVNRYEHGLQEVKKLMAQTNSYQSWKSPVNKQIENDMRQLQQTLETKQPQLIQPKIMLQFLKEDRLKRVTNNRTPR